MTFALVPDAEWPGFDKRPWATAPAAGRAGRLGRSSASDPRGVVCCQASRGRPRCACVCGVHSPLALVHGCARRVCPCVWCPWQFSACSRVRAPGVFSVRCPWPLRSCSLVCKLGVLCVQCPWPFGLLFTGVPTRCVVLRVRYSQPLGCYSPVCPLGVLCWVCGVLGYLAPVHRCACSVFCVMASNSSSATAQRNSAQIASRSRNRADSL